MKTTLILIAKIIAATVFFLVISIFVYLQIGTSINSIKNGRNLEKATEINIDEYFQNMYIDQGGSLFDNSWYILYEDSSFVYYSHKCIKNDKLACEFRKINKEVLNELLPVYKNPMGRDLFFEALNNFIKSKKGLDFNFNICKFIGESNGDRSYAFNKDSITVRGLTTSTCTDVNDPKNIKSISYSYAVTLSSKDFTIISGEWGVLKKEKF